MMVVMILCVRGGLVGGLGWDLGDRNLSGNVLVDRLLLFRKVFADVNWWERLVKVGIEELPLYSLFDF